MGDVVATFVALGWAQVMLALVSEAGEAVVVVVFATAFVA